MDVDTESKSGNSDTESQSDSINTTDRNDIIESIESLLISFLSDHHHLNTHDYNFDKYVKGEIFQHFAGQIDENEYDDIYDCNIEDIYIRNNLVPRSFKNHFSLEYFNDNHKQNNEQVEYLKGLPQPDQRTPEWYEFRYNHITGSNAWKIFGKTESIKNQLYYEKLIPFENTTQRSVGSNMSNSPMNWGHKYEPLTTMIYEYYNDVSVGEFGCIPHKSIPFLAASPDGIVTSTKLNGRMIEIKNVVSREITQIPKMDYYIQMQVQMEVCDLDECDFVETKFTEYENYTEFRNDSSHDEKGMIVVILVHSDTPKYTYEYAPLFQNDDETLDAFSESIYQQYNIDINSSDKSTDCNYSWVKNIYWKLDVYSNVLVLRNKEWFKEAFPLMNEFWENVISERQIPESYLKYQPKKRVKKEITPSSSPIQTQTCSKPDNSLTLQINNFMLDSDCKQCEEKDEYKEESKSGPYQSTNSNIIDLNAL